VPTSQASRAIDATIEELWGVISDPHHLPRWWPRVERVEEVGGDAFTEVMKTGKGKVVRADFKLTRVDEAGGMIVWAQQVQGTPFQRFLQSAETEIRLAPVPGALSGGQAAATEVTIELRQTLNDSLSKTVGRSYRLGSYFKGFGNHMVNRAAADTIAQALDGLERISGRA
jgi:uncharacterized protein YndB with AHSA1/START domain